MNPSICPIRKRASVACRCSYAIWSPIHAIDCGMIAAAAAPLTARKPISHPIPGASIAPRLVTTLAEAASAITGSLP